MKNSLFVLMLLVSTLVLSSCKKDDAPTAGGTTSPLSETFTDNRDGKTYKSIVFGGQTWMAENLSYATSTGSWTYNNDSTNGAVYGRLYNWQSAMTASPSGWHLPSDAEWDNLINSLAGSGMAGGKMKDTATKCWSLPNFGATNSSGFTALPAGSRYSSFNPSFFYLGERTWWWSSTEIDNYSVWGRGLTYDSTSVVRTQRFKNDGYSVRCVKN